MRKFALAVMAWAVAGVTPLCAAADYADAMKSGDEKNRACEFVGARADFAKAQVAGRNSLEKLEARKRIASTYRSQNDFKMAKEEYVQALAIEGLGGVQKAELFIAISEVCQAAQDLDGARAEVMKAMDIKDLPPEWVAMIMLRLSDLSSAKNDYASSREALKKGLAVEGLSPNRKADLQNRLGNNYLAEKDYANAKAAFAKIVDMPDVHGDAMANAQIMIGAAEQAGGNTKAAMDAYTKALEFKGASFWPKLDALRRMAGMYQADKKLAEAKFTLERAFALEGIDAERIAETYQGLADLCIQVQDWPGAQAALAKAMEVKGIGFETRANIMKRNADTLWWDRKGDAAVAQLNKIIADAAMPPNQKADAQKRIGEYLAQSGRLVEGPSKAELQNRLANACLAKNDYAGAKAAFARIADMTDAKGDDRANALIRLGSIYLFEKKFSEARTEFARVLTMTNVSPDAKLQAQLNIINTFKGEQNTSRAREVTRKLLDMPNLPADWKEQAQKYLDETK